MSNNQKCVVVRFATPRYEISGVWDANSDPLPRETEFRLVLIEGKELQIEMMGTDMLGDPMWRPLNFYGSIGPATILKHLILSISAECAEHDIGTIDKLVKR